MVMKRSLRTRKWYKTVIYISLFFNSAFAQIQTNVPALKDVYAKDFYIGCLLSYAHVGFSTDPYVSGQSSVVDANGGYLIKYHMNSMSPGNWMKPVNIVSITTSASAYSAASTQAIKDSIDVNPKIIFNGNITAQLNWAQRQGFTFRGHTLVWYNQTPGTAFFRSGYTSAGTRLSKEKMTARMENFIKETIRIIHESWPGLLSAMDVVNEAVNDNGSVRTTDSEWYVTFGDSSYIMKAFEFARKYTVQYGETQMKLYYNDYSTATATKADGIVKICGPIFRAGLLDGIGMQEHDNLSYPTAAQWIATYNKFDTICTEMAVTEFDVDAGVWTNWPSTTVLARQANQYGQLFKCFVERSSKSGRGKIISVSKDGLNDAWTFVKYRSTSLWDTLDQCKPAFYAVVRIGQNYHLLDSLVAFTDTLTEERFTPESWSRLASAVTSAKLTMVQNYSLTVSADTTLWRAKDTLQDALNGMVLTSVNYGVSNAIKTYSLEQNYPNPFNPATNIEFQIAKRGYVTLKVYDMLGREVRTLVNGYKDVGGYSVVFTAGNLPSGVYFYQFSANNFIDTKRLLLLK
jgi:GH35 family endo-1,4-beta-xylanase